MASHEMTIQPPIYSLFEEVIVISDLESGYYEEKAVITGYLLDPDTKIDGWTYQVTYYEPTHCPWLGLPYREMVLEHDLRPIEQAKTA